MLVIGISGGTGSGKTTLVDNILKEIDNQYVNLLSQDNYYKDNSHLTFEQREKQNYDHPDAIDFQLLVNHIKELKQGNEIEQPLYDFSIHNRTGGYLSVLPKKILIVEGILIFNDQPLLELLDLKIFVDADPDERLIRRISRDVNERGRDVQEVMSRYQTTLKPMHEQYIEPSKNQADIIIPNMKYNPNAVNFLIGGIQNYLK